VKRVKLRLSRTLVAIIGSFVLIGGSGAAALFVSGVDLLGPSYQSVNGLECTTLQLVKIKREQHYWVRKYVFTEGGDGMSRLKTALRVARSVEASEKADLIQVTVLDKAGPIQRASMRGRAIGAQVVYIPDVTRAPDLSGAQYSAFYVEGDPTKSGEFYGQRVDPTLESVGKMAASLTDGADCLSPVMPGEADGTATAGAHSGKPKAGGGVHAAPTDAEATGPAAAKDEHGEQPAAKADHATQPTEDLQGEAVEGGLISYLKGMIFAPAPTEVDGPSGGNDGQIGEVVVADPVAPPPLPERATGDEAAHDGIDPIKVAAPEKQPGEQGLH
jgi:hypothetical protein